MICLFLVMFSLFVICNVLEETECNILFTQFMKLHEKMYHNDQDAIRLSIFKDNVDFINAQNANESKCYTLKVIRMTDLKMEEVKVARVEYVAQQDLLKTVKQETVKCAKPIQSRFNGLSSAQPATKANAVAFKKVTPRFSAHAISRSTTEVLTIAETAIYSPTSSKATTVKPTTPGSTTAKQAALTNTVIPKVLALVDWKYPKHQLPNGALTPIKGQDQCKQTVDCEVDGFNRDFNGSYVSVRPCTARNGVCSATDNPYFESISNWDYAELWKGLALHAIFAAQLGRKKMHSFYSRNVIAA